MHLFYEEKDEFKNISFKKKKEMCNHFYLNGSTRKTKKGRFINRIFKYLNKDQFR